MNKLLNKIKDQVANVNKEYSLEEYLDLCKKDSSMYLTAQERLLKAIGEPELIDTKKDAKLGRIFQNKIIKIYPAFKEFYGMEETVERIVSFFKHAAQGLEESKQILYCLGPVGGGKSSLAEKIKSLMQKEPIYVLKYNNEISPIYESPLGLFIETKEELEKEYNIPIRYLPACLSPWAIKKLEECEGDISGFKVVKMYPSIQRQIAISKVEPGDENNQDISSLVGKVDLRKLGEYVQSDPNAYSYSGGLCISNQGVMEFVEMFKAPIKMLHPLLTATQEKNYKGTEPIGAIPFNGIIVSHSNESEWLAFANDKKNEAFLDRVFIVRIPYVLRIDEEIKIYEKLISNSSLKESICAPKTLEMLAEFCVLTRLKEPNNSKLYSKLRIYNGESLKQTDPSAKALHEYKETAGVDEGMEGISTRFAFKVLSRVFNFDNDEIAANPVHLLYVLSDEIVKQQFPEDIEKDYLDFIKSVITVNYIEFLENELQKSYIDSYYEYGQNLFEKYIVYADFWIQDNDYRDADTGEIFDRSVLNEFLEKIEKTADIANPKDFRHEIVNYVLRVRAKNKGEMPKWDSYEKIKNVIEKKIFSSTEDLLPIISFGAKSSKDEEVKHDAFVNRMIQKGYTEKQIKLLVDWFLRMRKNLQ